MWSLSPWHCMSLECVWRRQHADLGCSCSCGQLTRGCTPAWWVGEELTISHLEKTNFSQNVIQGLGFGSILWNDLGNGKWI